MFRTFLYGFLGFIIFGIVGIVVGSNVYGEDTSTSFNFLAGGITLVGTVGSILFARWMNNAGAGKLTQFSGHPKIDYGIWGAILGGIGAFKIARHLDPTDGMPLLDLIGIALFIFLGAIIAVYIARLLNLPSFMETTIQ